MGLGVAVLIDATIIRSVLLPATKGSSAEGRQESAPATASALISVAASVDE